MFQKILVSDLASIECYARPVYDAWQNAIKQYNNPIMDLLKSGCPNFTCKPTCSFVYARSNYESEPYLMMKKFLKSYDTTYKDSEAVTAYLRASQVTSFHHAVLRNIIADIEKVVKKETFAVILDYLTHDFNFYFTPMKYGASFENNNFNYVDNLVIDDLSNHKKELNNNGLSYLLTKTKVGETLTFLNKTGYILEVLDNYIFYNYGNEILEEDIESIIENYSYMINKNYQFVGKAKYYFDHRMEGLTFLKDKNCLKEIYIDLNEGVERMLDEVYGN